MELAWADRDADRRLMPPERRRIVVAEDDTEMRRLLADGLAEDGYEVVEVSSGLELFDELRRARANDDPPALIVSDIRMPGPSGLAVLRTIRTWGWTLPAIVITGFGDDETNVEAVQAGATCLFSKPLDLDDLRMAVMHFLRKPGGSSPPAGSLQR